MGIHETQTLQHSPERSNTPHGQTITTISTPTLSLSSLTMMFIHQVLCLAVIATRVRSMQEHRCLQSPPTFQKMVYDEDMRCARIVRYNPANRRRLGGADSSSLPRRLPADSSALYSDLPVASDHCNECKKTVSFAQRNADHCSICGNKGEGWKSTPDGIATKVPKQRPITTKLLSDSDNSDSGYSGDANENLEDSRCITCGKKSAGDPHTGEDCPGLFHTKRIQSRDHTGDYWAGY